MKTTRSWIIILRSQTFIGEDAPFPVTFFELNATKDTELEAYSDGCEHFYWLNTGCAESSCKWWVCYCNRILNFSLFWDSESSILCESGLWLLIFILYVCVMLYQTVVKLIVNTVLHPHWCTKSAASVLDEKWQTLSFGLNKVPHLVSTFLVSEFICQGIAVYLEIWGDPSNGVPGNPNVWN